MMIISDLNTKVASTFPLLSLYFASTLPLPCLYLASTYFLQKCHLMHLLSVPFTLFVTYRKRLPYYHLSKFSREFTSLS